jgi:hypothetical protein
MAKATGVETGRDTEASDWEPTLVVSTIVLVMPAVALGRIWIFSGVNAQEDWSGRPEQESVTNIGAVRFWELTGVMVVVIDPDWPGVRVIVAGATATVKLGAVLVWASTRAKWEREGRWDASPT